MQRRLGERIFVERHSRVVSGLMCPISFWFYRLIAHGLPFRGHRRIRKRSEALPGKGLGFPAF
jgi:hypothetical protein